VNNNILAMVIFGSFVEWVDEVHHVKTPLTEGATYWRTCRSFATRNAQLEVADAFLCHLLIFLLRLFEALRRKLRLNVRNAEYYNLFIVKSQSVE
jgi:hypothetical protein